MPLVACRRCSRHIRAREPRCPFCAASVRRVSAVALTLGAGALVLGCNDAQPPPASQADIASLSQPDAAAAASSPALSIAAPPAPDAAAAPSAAPTAPDPSASPRDDPSDSMTGALYGGPPLGPSGQGSSTGLGDGAKHEVVGDVAVTTVAMSVPIPDSGAVIANARAAMRRCFNAGLKDDPSMAGEASFVVKVSPSGEVDSATVAKRTGVSEKVAACMAGALRRAQFTPPGATGSTVSLTVKCTRRGR